MDNLMLPKRWNTKRKITIPMKQMIETTKNPSELLKG
jgi:hypothetical protein